MRLYLAGPMTGYAEFNYPAFNAAAAQLRAAGYTVVNPAEEDLPVGCEGKGTDDPAVLRAFMKLDLPLMLDCDGVACLDGWDKSRGTKLETDVAHRCGLPVRYFEAWLDTPLICVSCHTIWGQLKGGKCYDCRKAS